MGLLERLFDPSGLSDDELRRLTETVDPQPTTEDWFWGRASATGSEEDYFWRRLSDNWPQKDVLPGTYLEIHNQVYEAFNANPMANAIVEMGVNFVLGDGLQIDCHNKKVQRLVDGFWNDPDNHMNIRQYEMATELSLYGELFVRFFVNPYDGHVKLALLDPSLVDQIETDPDNIERQLRVHRRPLAQSATAPVPPGMAVDPRTNTPLFNSDPAFTEGVWYRIPEEMMHFAVNKVSNAKRGKSDLATLLPWLRRYKDWLIDRVRINKYKAAFLWDVTLSGATRKEIEQKMMEYARPPEPGSVLIHNESETWQAVQPNIDATNVAADGHAIKLMIAMGAGLPEHYLSDGGDVNRATAAEMGLPTVKRYQRRQDYLKYMLTAILDRVIAEAQKAGRLPRTIDTGYEIKFPQLLTDDVQQIGMGTHYMTSALASALSLGLVSHETASRIFFTFTREQVDLNEEWERIRAEQDAQVHLSVMAPGPAAPAPGQGPGRVDHAPSRGAANPTGARAAGATTNPGHPAAPAQFRPLGRPSEGTA